MSLFNKAMCHKIRIYCSDDEKLEKIITFASFENINIKNLKEVSLFSYKNTLVNPYLFFKVRFNRKIKVGMEIEFLNFESMYSRDGLKNNFKIKDIVNWESKNIFLILKSIRLVRSE